MSAMIIWMDSTEAKIFQLKPGGVEAHRVTAHGKSHHTETLGRNHSIEQSDEGKFFSELCKELKTVKETEWLIAGPGMGRKHFATYMEKHHPEFSKFVKGNEAMEKLTDNQIVAEGRKFFKHEHVFENI